MRVGRKEKNQTDRGREGVDLLLLDILMRKLLKMSTMTTSFFHQNLYSASKELKKTYKYLN